MRSLSTDGVISPNPSFRCGSKTLLSVMGSTAACLHRPMKVIPIRIQARASQRSGMESAPWGCAETGYIQVSPIYQLQVTFAALQNLKENVFNPVRLVESLHLKVSEQQDAQE
jgi:hypothetical protein